MNTEPSTSSSVIDSGLQTPAKRRKIEQENTEQAIMDTMFGEIGNFGAVVSRIITLREPKDEHYRQLYRLYKAAVKALITLETECDLEEELKSLPAHAEEVLQSSSDNVKVWSQYFYKNPSPTKLKGVKTIPSPPTTRIGTLLHSIGSFYGLTAEAVCSNKRKPENNENMEHLLKVAKEAIDLLKIHRDKIVKILEPFLENKRDSQDANH